MSQDQLINANLTKDAAAITDVQRALAARGARFEAGGQFDNNKQGTAGLGAATR